MAPVPAVASANDHDSVPSKLVKVFGSLLDDPVYSDVEFVLSKTAGRGKERTILASSKVLKRFDYFQSSMSLCSVGKCA